MRRDVKDCRRPLLGFSTIEINPTGVYPVLGKRLRPGSQRPLLDDLIDGTRDRAG